MNRPEQTYSSSRRFASAFLLVLLAVAFGFRTVGGLDWDKGTHLHPDERFLTMVASAVRSPDSLALYLDTANSPLNPYNQGYNDFFYGTLPLFAVRYMAEWADTICVEAEDATLFTKGAARLLLDADEGCSPGTFTSYDNVHLMGRLLSALADVGALFFLFLIGRRLYGATVGLLAVLLGTFAVFPIQHSHFFAVDNLAHFFVVVTLYFSVRAAFPPLSFPPNGGDVRGGGTGDFVLAGLASGFSMACKISVWPTVLVVGLAGLYRLLHALKDRGRRLEGLFLRLCLAALAAFLAFRMTQPYAFQGPGFFGLLPNEQWVEDMGDIRALTNEGEGDIPYARQWTNRTPVVFSWVNMVVWGLGIPLGVASWAGWALAGVELLRGSRKRHLIPWAWGTGFFLYQSTLWFKTMRYVLPTYYVLVLFGAYGLWQLIRWAAQRKWLRRLAFLTLALVCAGTFLWALAFARIYTRPITRIAASHWINEHIPAGAPITYEHWDDAMPLRIPNSKTYRQIEMQLYNEDTPEKRFLLFSWLEAADYVILSSNRLYASIPRLAARYPLTVEYYRALFAGELGFELVADFAAYPGLGPIQFPDQENPFPLMEADAALPYEYYQDSSIDIHLPPAEEAFSVYDHPRVLIFRKTDAYSPQLVEEALGKVDVERALRGLRPVDATNAPNLLKLDPQIWEEQQAGGTWSEMFNRDGLLNRYPALAAVAWWIVVTLLGWLAFPLFFVALPRLRDRGYGLARVGGLLLVAYLTWLMASLHALPNTRVTIVRMVLLLGLISGGAMSRWGHRSNGVGWSRWGDLRRFWRRRRRLILTTEALFLLLYVAWIGVRLLHPDLWHTHKGGEKPMDLAYLNAVMKSTWFPPYNPWLSGNTINYYYFGFVIVGTLIKLVGTLPEIAYNLAVPLLFALTGVGAFSVAYNLFGGHRRGALLAGVVALVFTVVLGNLGVMHLIRSSLIDLGRPLFPSTIPGFPETVAMFRGLWEVIVHGARLSIRPDAWYWHPTRIIPQEAGNPIAEFPAFTFLYADLHAHMIAFPLTLLTLALIVYWVRDPRPRWLSLLLGGIVIGAIRPTNLGDYPTYLALGVFGLILGAWQKESSLKSLLWRAVALVGLANLLYLPYIQNYAEGYGAVELWKGLHTPVNIYLWIHGIMLFPLATRLFIEVRRTLQTRSSQYAAQYRALLAGLLIASLIVGVFLISLGCEVALVAMPIGCFAAYLVLLPETPNGRRLLWFMVGTAMALSLVVEIIAVKGDIGRMNSVFKFYLQIWILLAVASAVSLAWVVERARRWQTAGRKLWWGVMAALIFGGALFLPYGIRARAIDRMSQQAGLTLDGMEFMKYGVIRDGDPVRGEREIRLSGDYAALRWMQDNIEGSPVIMEGLGHREYLWANRVSIYTGLPAVVGWRWHQVQQRIMLPAQTVEWRRSDVNQCYNTPGLEQSAISYAQEILDRYGVRYIYVGEYERAYYDPVGLAKFDQMAAQGLLRVVYDAQGVKIYEVVE
jgi:YYY domain-containing protein